MTFKRFKRFNKFKRLDFRLPMLVFSPIIKELRKSLRGLILSELWHFLLLMLFFLPIIKLIVGFLYSLKVWAMLNIRFNI